MPTRIPALLIVMLCTCYSEPGSAALGGSIDSVTADQRVFQAERHSSTTAAYEVHQLTMPSGTTVREYADVSGRVFAVTWRGQLRPDFKQLLGDSFTRVSEAARLPHPDHHALLIHQPDLVVESTGHMRAFAGRAFLPLVVPAGVDAGSLQ
jgi:hypothetical protein